MSKVEAIGTGLFQRRSAGMSISCLPAAARRGAGMADAGHQCVCGDAV